MRTHKLLLLTIALLAGAALLASTASAAPVKPTDCQPRAHWLSLPSKSVQQKKVAVFDVCPTAYSRAPGGPIYCAVDDSGMMQGAQLCFQRQATAFRTVGNGYAPYYRQIDATYQLSQPFARQKRNIAGILRPTSSRPSSTSSSTLTAAARTSSSATRRARPCSRTCSPST